MTSFVAPLSVGAIALLFLLAAEYKDDLKLRAISKTVASSCFLWLALSWGALNSQYGVILLLAMSFCWMGDGLLVKPGQGLMFQLGIAAFLLGHLLFAIAFASLPLASMNLILATLLAGLFAWRVIVWLRPYLDLFMQRAVIAYSLAISAMLVVAAGAGWWPLLAATMFAVSDLSVARDRFIAPGFANVAWGLPLYYLSQVAMAATLIYN